MTVQWYFGRDADITGPLTGKQLSDLAASGGVRPSDTVWRDGVEMGFPAHRVKNLFRPAPAEVPLPNALSQALPKAVPAYTTDLTSPGASEASTPAHIDELVAGVSTADPDGSASAESTATAIPAPQPLPDDAELLPLDEPPAAENQQRAQQNAKRKARATAGRGVVIVGQDGTSVKYRKKCTACGFEDSSWRTMPIARGTTRLSFFCPKCRKKRDGEIHGVVL